MTTVTGIDILAAGLRVRALLWPLKQYLEQVAELTEEHPMLKPELEAANAHVGMAAEALQRAVAFLDAKLDAEVAP